MKRSYILSLLLVLSLSSLAQLTYKAEHALRITYDFKNEAPVYRLKPAVDIPLTAVTAGATFYGFSKIYSKEASSAARVESLDPEDLNVFDRWAAGLHSEKAANTSDMFFYGAMPVPLLLLLDKDIRKDAAKIGFLYLEAMSVTGIFYTGVPSLVDRYRPLTYSKEVPLDERTNGNNRNSLFAGHVALVGTSTFFAAKVFSDYHPTSNLKYVFWGAAALATGATSYLRHRAGKHFPTDILVGAGVGVLSGILVPHFHKVRLIKNQNLTFIPFTGQSNGLAVVYRL
jgi:membrane-associated phospholipid phosphatase